MTIAGTEGRLCVYVCVLLRHLPFHWLLLPVGSLLVSRVGSPVRTQSFIVLVYIYIGTNSKDDSVAIKATVKMKPILGAATFIGTEEDSVAVPLAAVQPLRAANSWARGTTILVAIN